MNVDEALEGAINQGRHLCWSNFHITINSNVVPHTFAQRVGMTNWLTSTLQEVLFDFDSMNGVLLKPAGSPNEDYASFGDNHLIETIRSRVSIEQGRNGGTMHAHVLLEISHGYRDRNEFGYKGVQLNRRAFHEFLQNRVALMPVLPQQRPRDIYLNIRLLTRATDNTNKWLTLQYLNKDRDIHGRNLDADRAGATERDLDIRDEMLNEEDNLILQ